MMRWLALFLVVSLLGCSSSAPVKKTDADYQRDVVRGMHDALLEHIRDLHDATLELQAAAPVPADRGWDPALDKDAIATMTKAWVRARSAYERAEGAIAPLFPDLDASIDARYEDFLQQSGEDDDLFDDQGVTGMHAVERILFAPHIPASVAQTESSLPGYQAAAWPSTGAEAKEFHDKLCQRLVSDTQTLLDQWTPQNMDPAGAFSGLVSLMLEQQEKVIKASTSEEESRYAERTMADIRDNLAGTRQAYALFQPWLLTKPDGASTDAAVEDAFDRLDKAYGQVQGDAIPGPPATWSSEQPSAADLQTPFGKLYSAVRAAVDPNRSGSVVTGMVRAASALHLAGFS